MAARKAHKKVPKKSAKSKAGTRKPNGGPRVKDVTAEQLARISKMREDGLSWAKIAANFGWPAHTAYAALKLSGK